MKAEINDKNKVKFFANYWGQKVFINPMLTKTPVANIYVFENQNPEDIEHEYLLLKPLSEVSNEEAILVSKIWGANIESRILGYSIISRLADPVYQVETQFRNIIGVVDYLRSKGYLIPWMGLTPEELIEAGWAKYGEGVDNG